MEKDGSSIYHRPGRHVERELDDRAAQEISFKDRSTKGWLITMSTAVRKLKTALSQNPSFSFALLILTNNVQKKYFTSKNYSEPFHENIYVKGGFFKEFNVYRYVLNPFLFIKFT